MMKHTDRARGARGVSIKWRGRGKGGRRGRGSVGGAGRGYGRGQASSWAPEHPSGAFDILRLFASHLCPGSCRSFASCRTSRLGKDLYLSLKDPRTFKGGEDARCRIR